MHITYIYDDEPSYKNSTKKGEHEEQSKKNKPKLPRDWTELNRTSSSPKNNKVHCAEGLVPRAARTFLFSMFIGGNIFSRCSLVGNKLAAFRPFSRSLLFFGFPPILILLLKWYYIPALLPGTVPCQVSTFLSFLAPTVTWSHLLL